MTTDIIEIKVNETTCKSEPRAISKHCEYNSLLSKKLNVLEAAGSWCEYQSPLSIGEIYRDHQTCLNEGKQSSPVFTVISLDGRSVFSVTRRNFPAA